MGDFDECIQLRPDSALAQAQKCFALVSTNRLKTLLWLFFGIAHIRLFWLSIAIQTFTHFMRVYIFSNLFSNSTDRLTLETTHPKFKKPWMALKMLSGGFQSVLRVMLCMHRYC